MDPIPAFWRVLLRRFLHKRFFAFTYGGQWGRGLWLVRNLSYFDKKIRKFKFRTYKKIVQKIRI